MLSWGLPRHPVDLWTLPMFHGNGSGKPVSQLRIGVASAFPAAPDAAPFLSITEVILKSFPS